MTYRRLGHGAVEIYRIVRGIKIILFRGPAPEAAEYPAYRELLAEDLAQLTRDYEAAG